MQKSSTEVDLHPIDPEVFALSEMLQWVWRSRIRNGQPIKVCILSDRMLRLFQHWLSGSWEQGS